MTDPTAAPKTGVPGISTVSAVVVTWNSEACIADCLRSLREAARRVDLDIIVVDNGSTDDTVAIARATDPHAKVIVNSSNRGLAAANNQGMAVSEGDAVLIANPDTIAGSGAIDGLAALLDRVPAAAIAVPRLLHADGSVHTAAGDLPGFREAMAGRQLQRARGATTGFWWDGWAHDQERRIGRGHEAFYLVRTAAIDRVGVQDERYRLDWEGIDWTDRFTRAGWEVWFTPDSTVTHLGGASIRRAPFRWVIQSHRGMYRYFADRRAGWQRPLVAVLVGARAALKVIGLVLGPARYQRGQRGPLR